MNGGILWGRPRPRRGCSAIDGWVDWGLGASGPWGPESKYNQSINQSATCYKINTIKTIIPTLTISQKVLLPKFFSHCYKQLISKHMTAIYYDRYVDAISGIIAKILNSPFSLSALLVRHTSECCMCLRMSCLMAIRWLSSQYDSCLPENLSVASWVWNHGTQHISGRQPSY
jgi:hypothetical protein